MYPQPQESSIARDYIMVVVVVCAVCAIWIIANEFVLKIGNIALDITGGPATAILNFIILSWRLAPIIIIIGVFVWAFMRAFKREPYEIYTGGLE